MVQHLGAGGLGALGDAAHSAAPTPASLLRELPKLWPPLARISAILIGIRSRPHATSASTRLLTRSERTARHAARRYRFPLGRPMPRTVEEPCLVSSPAGIAATSLATACSESAATASDSGGHPRPSAVPTSRGVGRGECRDRDGIECSANGATGRSDSSVPLWEVGLRSEIVAETGCGSLARDLGLRVLRDTDRSEARGSL